jgi:hypothetical protein
MPALADLQAAVRRAVVGGDSSVVGPLLKGGGDPRRRLAIHQRHYAASLTAALLTRFPATVWLIGSDLATTAARTFVATRPPTRPCIAEYGEDFPAFVAGVSAASSLPYLEPFARLEWHLGRLALAVDHPAISNLSAPPLDGLEDLRLQLQPGVQYLDLAWPVDRLISVFLTETEPEQFELEPEDVWLEVRGVRGALHMTRLSPPQFVFRSALARGASLGDAVLLAVTWDTSFDVGAAFTSLLAEQLVTGTQGHQQEAHP